MLNLVFICFSSVGCTNIELLYFSSSGDAEERETERVKPVATPNGVTEIATILYSHLYKLQMYYILLIAKMQLRQRNEKNIEINR